MTIKPIFSKDSSAGGQLLILGAIALLLILAGQRGWLGGVRTELSRVAEPFYNLTSYPARALTDLGEFWSSREQLREDNERLRAEALILQAKVQRLASLRAENMRLRELMNSARAREESVVVAEVIGVSPDPTQHQLLIDKGLEKGVFVGQPVIDADGLVGQVIEVGHQFSRVMMITDAAHALSVQVNRNGVRAVAEGTGLIDLLELSHVAATTDIKADDLLVSSGLGGRFPPGYPVARVIEVTIDPGQPFATVRARPLARLDRSRHLLLVFGQSGEGA